MDVNSFDFSLILACYNESLIFEDSVQQIVETLQQTTYRYEIIFVDDCSSDNTRELILKVINSYNQVPMRHRFHEKNTGRGGAVSDGFRMARGEIVGYIDIDLEVHARYIPSCLLAIEKGADIAIAHRVYTFRLRSIDRYIASKGYKWLKQKLLNIDIQDTETGFKFFRRSSFLPIIDEIQDKGWFWDTESMVRASLHGLKIIEIPCLFIRRFDKMSSVRLIHDTVEYFGKLWAFRKTLKKLRTSNK